MVASVGPVRRLASMMQVAVAVAMLGVVAAPEAGAQTDVGKALIGTWKGEIGRATGLKDVDNPQRTLVIESVEQKDGRWTGVGRFGVTGTNLVKVPIDIDLTGARPWLAFTSRGGVAVRLNLMSDKRMSGTAKASSTSARDNTRPFELEKASE